MDYKFEGWLGKSPESIHSKIEWGAFTPKKWTEDNIDIKVTHCDICGSNLHTLKSGWGPTQYPCYIGHEIVGKAVRVGQHVKHVKIYAMDYPNGTGMSFGGYADYNRLPRYFIFKIPDSLLSEAATPILYARGKIVGIVSVGGLGHFGVLFIKALRANRVIIISRKSSKKDKALALRAIKNSRTLDFIISIVSSPKMPITEYLSLLKVGGTLFKLEILQLASEKNIKPRIKMRPIKDANKTIIDMENGLARYHYVLVNEKNL
ncbi:zinc-binding dehydrogenase [Fusarium avenaceum]|nr:zinc-binding dehydrogenase [Fusarium avenaceum]